MIKYKILFSFILLFFCKYISAQITEGYESSLIHIESKKGTNKKSGTGYFFGFTSKNKTSYSAIVVNKEVINGSENIQLFFNKEKVSENGKSEIYMLAIPNNNQYVFNAPNPENKLALIHMGKIYGELEKKGITTSEVYLLFDYIEMLQIPISEKDLMEIKENWETVAKK